MNIHQHAPPGAFAGRTAAFAARPRESIEAQFLRLYALRDAIDARLRIMADVLDEMDAVEDRREPRGGAHG